MKSNKINYNSLLKNKIIKIVGYKNQKMNCCFRPSINERYYETLNTKTNELINEETSSKLLSHMPSPMYKDTLNQYTSTSNFSSAMSSNLYENYDRYARPTENIRSPFFYGLSQTSPPSKGYAERPYDTHKQEEGKQLKNVNYGLIRT
jgi:hypothetical protein